MTPEQFRQKIFMNGNLASFQGRELLLIIVNQNDFLSQVGKARPGHEPNVSRSHDCNMHPLLRISTITLSVFLRRLRESLTADIGQTSHLYVTTVTASAEATLGTRDVDRRCPKLQDFERTIQVMRLRSSLAFQLPPAENFSPSAPSPTPPPSLTPDCLRSQTLPAPINNQTCRSAA